MSSDKCWVVRTLLLLTLRWEVKVALPPLFCTMVSYYAKYTLLTLPLLTLFECLWPVCQFSFTLPFEGHMNLTRKFHQQHKLINHINSNHYGKYLVISLESTLVATPPARCCLRTLRPPCFCLLHVKSSKKRSKKSSLPWPQFASDRKSSASLLNCEFMGPWGTNSSFTEWETDRQTIKQYVNVKMSKITITLQLQLVLHTKKKKHNQTSLKSFEPFSLGNWEENTMFYPEMIVFKVLL